MGWFVLAAAACVCFCVAACGTLVPLRDVSGIEYLYVWPGLMLSAWSSIALTILTGLYLVVRRAARHSPAHRDEARSGRWLAPLSGLASVAFGILPALPGVGKYGAPAAYFLYDLRWWWLAALGGWTLCRANACTGGALFGRFQNYTRWNPPARKLLLEGVLLATVIVWAIVTTPNLRFIGALHGDEPKYVRLCEVWYQGGGFDISQKAFLADQPLDASPQFNRTLIGLLHASAEEIRALGSDLRHFAADPVGFRWNRAVGGDGFVKGKHGGIYQVHQAGLSAMLFPGYVIDRYLLGTHEGYDDEFPDELMMTDLTMLLLYAAGAIALFRLLQNVLGDERLAWMWAAIGAMTLPTAAFAFQLYTEIPAALMVVGVTGYLMFVECSTWPSGAPMAAVAGAGAAGLSWLHPRFLLVSLCLAALAWWQLRAPDRRRTFFVAFFLMLFSLMAFDYRVTGSWRPTALWDAAIPAGPLSPSAVPLNLIAYALDWQWGLLPHAPILLAVLPGLAFLARRAPRDAGVLVALGLALAIPASGHTINAAGGTPDRLVLAVVPLALWPVARLVRALWGFASARVTTVILVVLSLDAALAYNWSHKKQFGTIRDTSVSGWKPNLAFPRIRDDMWPSSRANFELFLILVAVLAGLSVLTFLYAARPTHAPTVRPVSAWMPPAIVLAFIAVATAATAANAAWYYYGYMIDDAAARRTAAEALVAFSRCNVCFTSRSAAFDWARLEPNDARGVTLDVDVTRRTAAAHIHIDAPAGTLAFGRARVEYGDGASSPWEGIVSEAVVSHTYARAGVYALTAWLQMRDGTVRNNHATLTVR